jgi:hypothetical protein
MPHVISGPTPPQLITMPAQLSMWGNSTYGDCVTAEEAFAKACNQPEIFVPDSVVEQWAQARGFLNGADLSSVLTAMAKQGFSLNGTTYNDGPATSVDWTDSAALQNAISQGPVKIGVAADQLEAVVNANGDKSGWFATGFNKDRNLDHCVSLCGYGSIPWIASQLGVSASVSGSGYALFTWNSIGIIDVASMIAITGEAWLRSPTTIVQGVSPVQPPSPQPSGLTLAQVIAALQAFASRYPMYAGIIAAIERYLTSTFPLGAMMGTIPWASIVAALPQIINIGVPAIIAIIQAFQQQPPASGPFPNHWPRPWLPPLYPPSPYPYYPPPYPYPYPPPPQP